MSRARRPKAAPGAGAGAAGEALSLRHPAMLLAAGVAGACIAFTVTYLIIDSDFWQHLLVGRVMWERHAIPRQHLWSWVSYGRPEVLPSWGFRALLWPFYAAGGVIGLFAWRWLTTLGAFGFLWSAARRMGARGFTPLVVLVWCALIYRGRSQVRPETLAAVLMAVELWILEGRRHAIREGDPRLGHLFWLVPLAWVWVNVHVSYFIAFVLLGIHAVGVMRDGREPARAPARGERVAELKPIAITGLAMVAACLVNPFGWQALWQPFDYALHLSKEPLFRGIGELQPMAWGPNARSGAWAMIVLWPVLLLWRWRRHGLDVVEALTCALATAYAVPSQRFVGVYALAAAPYLARDLEAWVEARRWPAWTLRPAARTALAATACVVIGIPEARRPILTPGVGIALERFPVAAGDFMERHGVRGHGFSHFRYLGYLGWRFWPDRDRLPFMDIHQSGTPEDRLMFAEAFLHPGATWPRLVERYSLDYALLDRRMGSGIELLDTVDADSSWKLVFVDDTAALFVRGEGPLAAVADSSGYTLLGGGDRKVVALVARAAGDSALRAGLRRELERATEGSRWNASFHGLLANFDISEGRFAEARRHLDRAIAVAPSAPGAHQSLGLLALWERRPREAVAEFERERQLHGSQPGLDLGLGLAWEQLGDLENARRHYRDELERNPGNPEARRRLEELERGGRSR